jgi:hypothetical protein
MLATVAPDGRGERKVSTVDIEVCRMSVCQCCMLSHANGECCPDDDHGGDGIKPWSDLEPGYSVTMGLLAEEHSDQCRPDDRETDRCGCEGPWFSWSRCDGCGSYLGGDRWAFTLWRREEATATAQ